MYLIKAGERIIYDSTDKNTYPVISPQLEDELNGAGSLSFTVLPGHPYYNDMKAMQTFITAYRDDEEIFYGRILSTDRGIDGQLEVDCEGGLTFFMDSEMSKATYNETVETFLRRIIDNHNSQMEEPKHFHLGEITVPKAIEEDPDTHSIKKWEFKIGGFASTKSVLESLVLGQFGGYLRVRADGNGGHLLDYIKDYSRTNTQLVRIGHNIVDKSDSSSGNGMFTILRPIYGQNSTIEGLTQSDVTLPNVTLNGEFLILDDMVAKYGKIIHTEAFDKTSAKMDCLRKAEEFILKQGGQIPSSSEIGFVDFYHLNEKDFEEKKEEARQIDYEHLTPGITFQLGNVDLFNRPVISLHKVIDAGWNDSGDPDSMATLYSITYTGGVMHNLNPGAKYNKQIITALNDGTFKINGTTDSTLSYYFINNNVTKDRAIHMPPGTYTVHYEILSGTLTGGGTYGYYWWEGTSTNDHVLQVPLNTANASRTFTEDAYLYPFISFNSGASASNAVIGLKIEKNTTSTPFNQNADYCMSDNVVFLATPILPYGEVLSPESFEGYFNGLVDNGARTKADLLSADNMNNGGKGLIIGIANMVGTPDNSIALAADWAESVHNTQEELYESYIQDIRLGDIFTNIEEYPGVTLTVGSISLDLENPGNDTMVLKNQEELNSSGVTNNSLTIIESKYAKQETFRYHYITETVDELNGLFGIYAPQIEMSARNIRTIAQNTQLVVQRKQGSTSQFEIHAVDFDEDPLHPGEYVPTILMNINGVQISDGTLKNEDGEDLAGKASLTVEKNRITEEVTRATGAESSLDSRLTLEEGKMTGVVADIETITDDVGDLQISYETITGSTLWATRDELVALNGKFEVDANGVVHVIEGSGLMVDRDSASFGVYDSQNLTAGIIVNKVNGGSTRILGTKVEVDGTLLTDTISAMNAEFDNLVSGTTVASMLSATAVVASRLSVGGSFEFSGSTIGLSSINWGMASGLTAKYFLGPESMGLGHYHTLNVDSSTGQVTIGAPTLSTSGSTFNIADTTFYQQAVSAAEQAGEATGYTAGYADGYPASVEILGVSSPTKSGSIWTSTATAYVTTADGQATPSFPVTGMVVTGVYNAGANSVNLSESWNGATYTVSTTGQTTAHSASITLSATSAIVYNPSTHTYSAGATAEAGGATRAYDATPAESKTEAYDDGLIDGAASATIASGTLTDISLAAGQVNGSRATTLNYTTSGGGTGSLGLSVVVNATDAVNYAVANNSLYSASLSGITLTAAQKTGNRSTTLTYTQAAGAASKTKGLTISVDASAVYTKGYNDAYGLFVRTGVDVIGTSHRVPLTLSGPNTIVDEDGYVWRNMYYCSNWQDLYEKKTQYYYVMQED